MNFELSEEHKMLKDMTAKYAQTEFTPYVHESDQEEKYMPELQKKALLPPVCAGKRISAGAFTEPNAGRDVAGYGTRAVKDGNDYVINGNKMFITNGTVCDFMLTACITNPNEYTVEKLYRDAKVPELLERTREAEIMTIGRTLQAGYQAC